MNIYYVYAYLREDGTPYYVGKGCGKRAYDYNHTIKPPRDKSRVQFIAIELSEQDAFELEKATILVYGRKDLGTGILHNRTAGGEGSAGRICSEETRAKMSMANTGKRLSEETRTKIGNARKGKSLSDQAKQKLSAKKKGIPSGIKQSAETIAKRMRNGNGCNKPVTLQHKQTGELFVYQSRVAAERDLGIAHSTMLRIVRGKPTLSDYICISEATR